MTQHSLESEKRLAPAYCGGGDFPAVPMMFGAVIAAFIVVATMVGIRDGRNFSASRSAPVHEVASVAPGGADLGHEVRAGQLALVVTDITAPWETGDPRLPQATQGDRVLVGVRVINEGEAPQRFEPAIQQLIVGDESFGADQMSSQPMLGADLGPGDSVVASIAFDIPAGAEPSAIILRDSLTTPGAQVSLADVATGGVTQ